MCLEAALYQRTPNQPSLLGSQRNDMKLHRDLVTSLWNATPQSPPHCFDWISGTTKRAEWLQDEEGGGRAWSSVCIDSVSTHRWSCSISTWGPGTPGTQRSGLLLTVIIVSTWRLNLTALTFPCYNARHRFLTIPSRTAGWILSSGWPQTG